MGRKKSLKIIFNTADKRKIMQVKLLQDYVVPKGTILKMYDSLEVTYPIGMSNDRTEGPFGTLIVYEGEIKANPDMYEVIQDQEN